MSNESYPVNEDGSLEFLLESIDAFVEASPDNTDIIDLPGMMQASYQKIFPLIAIEGHLALKFQARITDTVRLAPGQVGEEYLIDFSYRDMESDRALFGTSFFIERYASRLLLSARWTADEMADKLRPRRTGHLPYWYTATHYDEVTLGEEFGRLVALDAQRVKRNLHKVL